MNLTEKEPSNAAFARRQMVRQQVRTWDVLDERVLTVLSELARDAFVPEKYRHLAYADVAIPLAHNQSTLLPSVEGRILQALDIAPDDRVLEVGTGCGFFTACLAQLGGTVVSLDLFADLSEAAGSALDAAGIANAELRVADAMEELPEESFDVVAVTGSTPELDKRFIDALAPAGRLLTIVGEWPVMQARLVVKGSGDTETSDTALFETLAQPLVGADRDTRFAF